ncbi:MAG: hypothetical protein IPH75_14630 [bacterium]|nr:hypothetical protein [bacterium]
MLNLASDHQFSFRPFSSILLTGLLYFILSVPFCTSCSATVWTKRALTGDFELRYIGDSTYLKFDLCVKATRVDTLEFSTLSQKFQLTPSVSPEIILKRIDTLADGYRWTGLVALSEQEAAEISECHGSVVAFVNDSVVVDYIWQHVRFNTVSIQYFQLAYGYATADSALNGEHDWWIGGIGIGAAYERDHTQTSLLFRHTASFDSPQNRLEFSEAIRGRFTWYTGTRTNFMPAPSLGLALTTLSLPQAVGESKQTKFGLEAGVTLEGPFERFSYHYVTSLDGYHKFGYQSTIRSGGLNRIGSLYEYYIQRDFRMLRIALVLDGGGYADGMTEEIGRTDDRPFWRKLPAWGATLPFLPVYGLIRLGYIVAGKEYK